MDFDSLKVTAKLNSGSFEMKGMDSAKVSFDTQAKGGAEVKGKAGIDTNVENPVLSSDGGYSPEAYLNELSRAVDAANENLKALMINREFSYRIHEATHRVIVDVKNSDTGEVIREIPSEDNLDMIAKMQELAGIIIDEKR